MNEKPHKLDMGFGEALARIVRVPKAAVVTERTKKKHKSPPQPAGKAAKTGGQQEDG